MVVRSLKSSRAFILLQLSSMKLVARRCWSVIYSFIGRPGRTWFGPTGNGFPWL